MQARELVQECGGEDVCRAVRQELATPEDGAGAGCCGGGGVWASGLPGGEPWDLASARCADRTMTVEQWRGTLGVNLDSAFGLVQAAVAQMQRQNANGEARGHIVLVSSTAGQRGEAFHADYAASKGALISLTKSLSSELAGQGIYCNCVAPGWVETEMSAAALKHPETSKKVLATIPLGRAARVEEIAGPILFLCTPLAGFVSGEIFNVNGGAVLVG